MAARLTFLSLLLFLGASISCRTSSDEITPRQFAQFYAEIVIAQESALDSATAIDSTFAIAERHGISPEQLERFRDRMHADPASWIEIWETVMEEVQSRNEEESK